MQRLPLFAMNQDAASRVCVTSSRIITANAGTTVEERPFQGREHEKWPGLLPQRDVFVESKRKDHRG